MNVQKFLPARAAGFRSGSTDHINPMLPNVLLIGRDPTMRIYTDEVLKRAGFQVHSVTPWEAKAIVNDGAEAYPLVIFCNTLYQDDVAEIGPQFRRRRPTSKLLLMLGPDVMQVNFSMFDSILEALDGPTALVREAHRLVGNSHQKPESSNGEAHRTA